MMLRYIVAGQVIRPTLNEVNKITSDMSVYLRVCENDFMLILEIPAH